MKFNKKKKILLISLIIGTGIFFGTSCIIGKIVYTI